MDAFTRLLDLFGWKLAATFVTFGLVFPLAVVVITLNVSWHATFSVTARTEVVQLFTNAQNMPSWYATISRLRIDGQDLDPLDAQIQIRNEARVRLVRIEKSALELDVTGTSDQPIAQIFDQADNLKHTATRRLQAEIGFPQPSALTLPIAGRVIIGDTVFSQATNTSPVLLSGVVKLFGLTAIGGNRYAAGEAALDPGDRFEIHYASDELGGYGLVRVEPEEAGLLTVFHADGEAARIIRFGTAGFSLSPSLWAQISSDPLYQSLLALYGALLPAIGIGGAALISQWRSRRLPPKATEGRSTGDESEQSEKSGHDQPIQRETNTGV